MVLTRWTAHGAAIADLLRQAGREPVVLRGGLGARQRAALDLLTPIGHPLVVVAIDSSTEEGFDEVQYLFPPRRPGRVRPPRSVQRQQPEQPPGISTARVGPSPRSGAWWRRSATTAPTADVHSHAVTLRSAFSHAGRGYVAALGGTLDIVATLGDRSWKVA